MKKTHPSRSVSDETTKSKKTSTFFQKGIAFLKALCYNITVPPIRPVGQAVKTLASHAGNMGSIPVRVTKKKQTPHLRCLLLFGDPCSGSTQRRNQIRSPPSTRKVSSPRLSLPQRKPRRMGSHLRRRAHDRACTRRRQGARYRRGGGGYPYLSTAVGPSAAAVLGYSFLFFIISRSPWKKQAFFPET